MSQSLVKNTMHLIFSTKNRTETIRIEEYGELRAYLIGILSNLGCYMIEFGGTKNHVHILFVLNKTKTISEIVSAIKSNTSRWIHTKHGNDNHSWQNGYAAFSVSESQIENVAKYIQNQLEHHKKLSFQDELLGFLKLHNIEFNEQYVWE